MMGLAFKRNCPYPYIWLSWGIILMCTRHCRPRHRNSSACHPRCTSQGTFSWHAASGEGCQLMHRWYSQPHSKLVLLLLTAEVF